MQLKLLVVQYLLLQFQLHLSLDLMTKGIRAFRVTSADVTDQFPQFTKLVGGDVEFVLQGTLDAKRFKS
jgi:hypothetical protein